MPTGDNPNSRANLDAGRKKFEKGQKKSKEEIAKREETKRNKRLISSYLELLLEKEVSKDRDGRSIVGAEALAIKAMQGALNGDWKAWEMVRDTVGQKPVEKISYSEISEGVIKELEAIAYDEE